MEERKSGVRPVFLIKAKNIPEAWEKAMELVWNQGTSRETQYDKIGNPPSSDGGVLIQVINPYNQPRFHRAFADGLGGVAEYVQEVVNGAHDYWLRSSESIQEEIRTGKKLDTKWIYTYHKRLFEHTYNDESGKTQKIDQIEISLAQRLARDPHTRRAQAITWVPSIDSFLEDPPCLQRIWARIFEDPKGKKYLNMDTFWRSRDLFKAWFENAIALTTLQARLAARISELRGEEILVGAYTDFSDSLHIYGSYFHEIEGDPEKGVKNFFENLVSRPFASDDISSGASRTYTSEQVREFFINDGLGKGLEPMLAREKEKMPLDVQEKIRKDLENLRNGIYIP